MPLTCSSPLLHRKQSKHHYREAFLQIMRTLAPVLISLTFATAAHAQGTMDFSGATTLMATFKTFAIYAGAVICFGGLIFAGIRMMSGRFQDAIPGLFGALFGAGVLGWGAGWIGYSQEYLDASSPRRQQIVEAVARSGFSGPEAAQIAAHNTRDGKQILSPAEVVAAHRQIAAEYGNQAENVVAEAQARRRSKAHQTSLEERNQQASSALTFARDKGFEREAVLDERAIFVDAMRRGMGEMTYPEVRANFEARIASGEFREVDGSKHSAGRHFTTAGTIQAEKEIIRSVQEGQGQAPQLMSIQDAIPLTDAHERLNDTQRKAIEQILTSRDQVQGLQGSAGSGKTSTLAAIRQGAEQNGYAVEGFAPTSRAAHQLREAGITADTLQGFLARARNTNDPSQKHLYMVDESSLASTEQMRDFLRKIAETTRCS